MPNEGDDVGGICRLALIKNATLYIAWSATFMGDFENNEY